MNEPYKKVKSEDIEKEKKNTNDHNRYCFYDDHFFSFCIDEWNITNKLIKLFNLKQKFIVKC